MSYQVLYRKYRPSTFDDIKGQDHIVTILKNQIISNKISHSYIFSGSRGTGKTSAAKVFARTVNCYSPIEAESCGECEYCKELKQNTQPPDIIEIDAASNRGIDEIRQIKENVSYLPMKGRFRIYIIDEVHMLTTEAFNALLKTLEEPPSHVIFIFCTTEMNKIPATILSRCQRFDFVRISRENIIARMKFILEEINVCATEEALSMIARNCDGALRDALTALDKAISISMGESITEDIVNTAYGFASYSDIFNIAENITQQNIAQALIALDNSLKGGKDIDNIIYQLIEYFRNLLIYASSDDARSVLNVSGLYIDSLKRSSVNIDNDILVNYITTIAKVKTDSRYFRDSRSLLEASILYLCNQDSMVDNISLTNRVQKLEARINSLTSTIEEMQKSGIRIAQTELTKGSVGGEKIKTDSGVGVSANDEESRSVDNEYTATLEPRYILARGAIQSSDNLVVAVDDGLKLEEKKPTASFTQNNFSEEIEVIPKTDRKILAEYQEYLKFASGFINNESRNIILSSAFSELKVMAFNDDVLYLMPTQGTVNMLDVVIDKNGVDELARIIENRFKKKIKIIILDHSKTYKVEDKASIDSVEIGYASEIMNAFPDAVEFVEE